MYFCSVWVRHGCFCSIDYWPEPNGSLEDHVPKTVLVFSSFDFIGVLRCSVVRVSENCFFSHFLFVSAFNSLICHGF